MRGARLHRQNWSLWGLGVIWRGPRAPPSAPAGLSPTALRATALGVRVQCGGPGSRLKTAKLRILPQGPRPRAKGTSDSTFFATCPWTKRTVLMEPQQF